MKPDGPNRKTDTPTVGALNSGNAGAGSVRRWVRALVQLLRQMPIFSGVDYHAEYWRIWRLENPDACILCAMGAPRHKCPNAEVSEPGAGRAATETRAKPPGSLH